VLPQRGAAARGHIAGDAADYEDDEHREQCPDATANAQGPTVRRVGPCHRTRAGEHEEPDREVGRAERWPTRTPPRGPRPAQGGARR